MRWKNLILIFTALATVVALSACGFLGQSGGDQGSSQSKQEPAKQQETPKKQVAPQQAEQKDSGDTQNAVEPPPNDTLKLTVPEMAQIKNDEIPTGLGTDDTLFHDYAGVHIKNTGFPWQKVANVYIAGHRLGFPNTNSHLAFWDLNKVQVGDEFYITDSAGRQYTYKVYKRFIATPNNLSVLKPVPGKNVVTLQTCTLPDYTNRFLVRAELQGIKQT